MIESCERDYLSSLELHKKRIPPSEYVPKMLEGMRSENPSALVVGGTREHIDQALVQLEGINVLGIYERVKESTPQLLVKLNCRNNHVTF